MRRWGSCPPGPRFRYEWRTPGPREGRLSLPARFATLLPLLLGGCLIPFPIEEQAPEENHAPACEAEAYVPPADEIRDYDPLTDGDEVVFQISGCDDPNEDDRLFWRWFIDYNPLTGFIADRGEAPPDQRGGAIRFAVAPCELSRTGGEVLHRVDLIVADRPFLSSPEDAQQAERRNQILPRDAGSHRVTWFLRFDDRRCR
ncbi:MAG: hypothetical protein H6706_24860 [Myxococcales bacterium]|nr:hypothetical protein [Myxococcales bacterium]